MTTLRARLALAGLTAATVAAGAAPAGADGAAAPRATTLASGLLSPLSVAVGSHHTVWLTQNFASELDRVRHGVTRRVFHAPHGYEVSAVSTRGKRVWFAVSGRGETFALLKARRQGRVRTVADLARHERRTNPDGGVTYGFRGLPASCSARVPAEFATHTGPAQSHPYATLATAHGVYVADAGANDVVVVRHGRVHTVAVIPPVGARITGAAATAEGLPRCTVGHTYWMEGVPTDVEAGPGGDLLVTSLPGGPEDGSLGRRGRVLRIDPTTGAVRRVVGHLNGPTGLAVAANGDLYIAELFGNRVSLVQHGRHRAHSHVRVGLPGDVEWTPQGLYLTADVLSGTSGQPGDPPAGTVELVAP